MAEGTWERMIKDGRWRRLFVTAFAADLFLLWALKKLYHRFASSGSAKRSALAAAAASAGCGAVDLEDASNGPLVLALDLDGTLRHSDGSISDRALRALRIFSARGGQVVVATGQPHREVRRIAEKLAANSLMICSCGSTVVRSDTFDIAIRNWLPRQVAVRLLAELHRRMPQMYVSLETENEWFVSDERYFACLDAYMNGLGGKVKSIAQVTAEPLVELAEARLGKDEMVPRLLAIHDGVDEDEMMETAREIAAEVAVETGVSVNVGWTGCPMSFDFMLGGVNKALALHQVCQNLCVPPSRTMAMGDQNNDVEMLQWAGRGVAVANAAPQLKAVANAVSPLTNDEDAVAVEVERINTAADERIAMRENLARQALCMQAAAEAEKALEAEVVALKAAVDSHEEFVELLKVKSPAKFTSPRKSKSR